MHWFLKSLCPPPPGELLGEVISTVLKPSGLQQLTSLPRGSGEAELMGIAPIYYVFHFLEKSEKWDMLGPDSFTNRLELRRKLKQGGPARLPRLSLYHGHCTRSQRDSVCTAAHHATIHLPLSLSPIVLIILNCLTAINLIKFLCV